MTETLALDFENVSKSFAANSDKSSAINVVVDSLSMQVRKGEFFSVLGPSGCGKTTTLRMISGLETPTSGTIRMSGRVVNGVHPHKRNVHTVFQKYALFPHLNVFENVAFGLRMKKVSSEQIKRRVNRMLEMVRLETYADRMIQQLSGGEQQRVALVRALVNEPEILLLDEPLGALDLKLREQMQVELVAIQKQLGTTFIFVTHDQGEALTLSDRIAIMNRGRIEQIGTPTEVYEHPASIFVAKFVGTSNVFEGTSEFESNSQGASFVAIQTSLGRLRAKFHNGNTRFHPRDVPSAALIVRPEKIRVRVTSPSGESGSADLNSVRGTLVERTYFGPTTQIKLKINDQAAPLIALIANQASVKAPTLKLGEKYYAVWDPGDSIIVPSDARVAAALDAPISQPLGSTATA